MTYSAEVKREKVGKYELVLIDDDMFYWVKVYEDGKYVDMYPLMYEKEYPAFKEKYSKM